MNWQIPPLPTSAKAPYFSRLLGASILLVVFMLFFCLGWLELVAQQQDYLLLRAFGVAALFTLIGFFMLLWSEDILRLQVWQIEQDTQRINYANWLAWADHYLILLSHAMVVPEPALAEKIIGLQGKIPDAAALAKQWQEDEHSDDDRYRACFDQLLQQLAQSMQLPDSSQPFSVQLYPFGFDNEADLLLDQLRESWQHSPFAQYRLVDCQSLAECPTFALLQQWIDEGNHHYQLLLIMDIATQDQVPAACALLFCRERLACLPLQQMSLVQQPQLLFRPVMLADNRLAQSCELLQALDYSQQQQPQYLWYDGFSDVQKAVFLQSLQNLPLAADKQYEMGKVLGNSPTFIWLSLALAAQACQLGRDNHLLAQMQPDNQLQMVRLSSQLPIRPMAEIKPWRLWRQSFLLLAISLSFLLLYNGLYFIFAIEKMAIINILFLVMSAVSAAGGWVYQAVKMKQHYRYYLENW